MKYFVILLLSVLLINCKNENNTSVVKLLTAEEIIAESITASGGKQFDNSMISFDFRDKYYKAKRKSGQFTLERIFKDSTGQIQDVLNNNGFSRMVNGENFVLDTSKSKSYSASVNSVHYFSVLPYGLDAKAVKKRLLEKELINNIIYYKIEVTFNQNGGGEDFEDVFIYWINKETFKPDYLAYSYNEDDDVGMRFREAYNERFVNRLRFVDYNNYKNEFAKIKLEDLGKAFENNRLKLVSKIELKNIEVKLIDL